MKKIKLTLFLIIGFFSTEMLAEEWDIVWIDKVGVAGEVKEGTLYKTAQNGWDNGGAASLNILPARQDGYVEYIADETGSYKMFGLSFNNTNAHYNTIDYAFYLRRGEIKIYISGKEAGKYGFYKPGYVLRIERSQDEIVFIVEDKVLRRERLDQGDDDHNMLVDVAIYNSGARFDYMKSSFGYQELSVSSHINEYPVRPDFLVADVTGASGNYSYLWDNGGTSDRISFSGYGEHFVTVTDESGIFKKEKFKVLGNIQWTDITGANISGTTITKTNANGWTSGAASTNILPAGEDGTVTYTVESIAHIKMFGLSYSNANASYTTINYAIYLYVDRLNVDRLKVYESGSYKGYYGTFSVGDKFEVKREGRFIKYYKNDTEFRSVDIGTTNANRQMLVDISMYKTGNCYTGMKCSFGDDLSVDIIQQGSKLYADVHLGNAPYQYFWNTGETTPFIIKGYRNYSVTITDNWGNTATDKFITPPAAGNIIENYVKTTIPREEVRDVASLETSKKLEHVSYIDDHGRVKQTVAIGASPAGKDIVQPIVYDEYGRQKKQYLPYTVSSNGGFRSNAVQEQDDFYSPYFADENIASATNPYYESRFDESPLKRVLESASPGESWQIGQNTVKYGYVFNDEVITRWKVDRTTGNCIQNGVYQVNTLYVSEIIDENSNKVLIYKTKFGQTILKKEYIDENTPIETYNVYNDLGQLSYVITPEGLNEIETGFAFDSDFAKKWCFAYKYDNHGRLIEKRIPGRETHLYVYDRQNRCIGKMSH